MIKPTFISAAAGLFLAHSLLAGDWAEFQGPNRDGTSDETGLNVSWGEDGPKILWSKELNEGFGGAAIVGEEVFILDRELGETDMLLCLNLGDGAEKWRFESPHAGRLPQPGSRGVPAVQDDAIYFVGGFGHVHRISRETKKADWTVSVQDKYGSSPPKWGWAQSALLVDDIVVVAAMSPTVGLVGLDKKSGEEVWRTQPFGDSHSNPALLTIDGVEQVTFVAVNREDEEGTVISVDPASGEVLWITNDYFNKIPIPYPMVVDNNRVWLTGGYECGSAMISVANKDASWQVKTLFKDETFGTQMHPPFLIDNHIFFLCNENANHKGAARKTGGLACMNLDGKIIWRTGDDPFMGRGGMLHVDGKLLIQDGETGYLRVVEPKIDGYKELAMADIFGKKAEVDEQIAAQEGRETIKMPDFKYWSPMALSNGVLIMRGQDQLKCIDLR